MLRKAFVRLLKIFRIPIFPILVVSSCILSGYVYLIATSITSVKETTYGSPEDAAGLSFPGIAGGMAVGALLCSVTLDSYTKCIRARHGVIKPEWRLPPMTLGFFIAPAGLFIYGWTARTHAHFAVPILGTALWGFAAYTMTVSVTMYLADVFGIYRASAMSAMTVTGNAISAVLPLAGPALYQALGWGWGNSVLALAALTMAPVPILLLIYSERIRRSSKIEEWS